MRKNRYFSNIFIFLLKKPNASNCTYSNVININLMCCSEQSLGKTLMGGLLSTQDVSIPYKSEASDTYKPYIVDPYSTQLSTDRVMKDR